MARGRTRTKRSEIEKRDTLNRFYNDLYVDKIRFKLSSQEVSDIRAAVIEVVNKIAVKLGHIDEKFRIRDVILVGSAREGTQITLPEEFDFLFVLDALSQRDLIEIKKICLDRENGVHIKLKDSKLRKKFKDLIKGDELMCTQDDSLFSCKNGLRESFGNGMTETMRTCVNEKASYSTGVLIVVNSSMKLHGPAFNPEFQWRRLNGEILEISVDLCPVIRIAGEFPELLKVENVACETYYKYAKKKNTIMVLPSKKGYSCQSGLCFSMIFTESEMALMEDLSEHHRKCYMLLKYLLNAKQFPSMGKAFVWVDRIVEPETAFFSYILKILVLDHHYIQKCTETKCFASCLERMLHKIINIAYFSRMVLPGLSPRNWLSNPFFKKQNVWSRHGLKLSYRDDLNIKLKFLILQLEFIGEMEEYRYEKCSIQTVRSIDTNILARPLADAILLAVLSVFLCPELGHLSENIFRFLVWKYLKLGKIICHLMNPVDCKNDKCCMPLEERKKVMHNTDSGLTMKSVYFMAAVEISVFAVYIYPNSGHLIGDMSSFLFSKFSDLLKQA